MRKTFLISAIIILTILAALFIWFIVARDEGEPLGEFIIDALPFGSGGDETIPFLPPDNGSFNGDPNINGEDLPPDELSSPTVDLFRLSEVPVAGFALITRNNQTVVRYAERATGHIYDAILPNGIGSAPLEKVRITNTTMPKIYEAYFRPDGNAVLLRSLRDDTDLIENISLTLTPPQSTSTETESFHTISSTPLRGNIGSVAVVAGNNLFYTLLDASSISASAFDGTGSRTLMSSAFTGWRLASAGNTLLAYTKASARAPGYAYSLNTTNGAMTKIVGPLSGLTAVPNSAGNRVAYSYAEGARTRLFSRNITNNETSELIPATLAEKCVWSATRVSIVFCGAPVNGIGAGEPDNWYRGATSFSDRIWMFDTNTDVAQIISEPSERTGVEVDVIEPKLSSNENYLVFMNKNDLSLWALRID